MSDTEEPQDDAQPTEPAAERDGEAAADDFWPGWSSFWESRAGLGVAVALTAVVCGALYFGGLSEMGVWEPWEAGDILVAREYQDRPEPEPLAERGPKAPSYNWAVPTRDGQPVYRSLLKTWLVSKTLTDKGAESGTVPVGELEFSARLPMAMAMLLISVLGLFWLRRLYGTWPALVSVLAFASTPAIYLGVHNVSAEMLYVATTTAAIMAFVALMYAEGWTRYLWGLCFGVALGLAFWDQRYMGILIPLATIAGFGVTQLPYLRAARAGRRARGEERYLGWPQILGAVAALLGAGATVWWAFSAGNQTAAPGSEMKPHIKQIMLLVVPAFVVLSGLILAWKTRVVRRLRSPAGLVGLAVAAAMIVPVLEAYADANPTLLKHGEVVGKIPVASYALQNTFYGAAFPLEHLHFAMWIRQVGFALIPWVALVPLGAGYLARSARLTGPNGGVRDGVLDAGESVKRLFLVWGFLSVVLVAFGSTYNHFFYPAYFPLVAGVGLMLSDAAFWRRMRVKTLLPYLMGFAAVAVTLMLGKDLERWPARFVEFLAMFQEDIGLPEAFSYGSTMKAMKYGWVLAFMTFFFGLVSWAIIKLRWAKNNPWTAARLVYAGVVGVLGALALDAQVLDGNSRMAAIYGGAAGVMLLYGVYSLWTLRADIARWFRQWGETEGDVSMARERALAKARLRREDSWAGALTRLVETSRTGGALLVGLFVASAGVVLFALAPKLGNHLSQRGVFETYSRLHEEGQPLKRYQVSTGESSIYLRNVDALANRNALMETFQADERMFAVIRRDALSTLNKYVRQQYDRNIPVLDARSSQLLLISNKLKDGEENQNFVADAIVEDTDEIQHKVTYPKDGKQVRATFDNRLELLGYTLDKSGEVPGYGWGETAKLSTYFRVKRSIPASYQIFLHVDRRGSRIHGDHYPMGGDFPTNDWLPGDIVKDVYELQIDQYATTGVYTIHFGFYRGGNRMKVQPRSAHDGENRLKLGQIRVTGF